MRFPHHDLVPYGKFAPSLRLTDSYVGATSGPRLGPGGIFVGLLSSGTPGRLIHRSHGVTPSSVGIHLRRYIQTLHMIRFVIINLLISFLKTATIPTYQGISIAFPRYIVMQHPPSDDLIFMPYMLLACSMSRMLVGPFPNHCYMTR